MMKIVHEGLISLYSFLSVIILPLISIPIVVQLFSILYWESCVISICLSFLVINGFYAIFGKKCFIQVVVRATFLGSAFCAGICLIILSNQTLAIFGWYTCVLSFFHYSEYLTIAVTNPKTLTTDAFMLNHSLAYKTAAAASWIEFFIEYYFYPDLKSYYYISIIGLLLCIIGEVLRKLAMLTASTNFNHIVQTVKERDHTLITHGVYSLCRHPSYVGWFYWSIGTQLILVNPVCVVIYAMASWSFFHNRVVAEEETLINFFGEQYVDYKQKVPTGLPFIKGIPLQ